LSKDLPVPETGGHLWGYTHGPDRSCKLCGLFYARWRGDRCDLAPDCGAVHESGIRCGRESGHPYKHVTVIEWSAVAEPSQP